MITKPDPAPAVLQYSLPEEQLARAQYYICYERHLFHRYCILRDSPMFPLFFMDRCYDWQFERTGSEPLFSRYNGFMELICRESWVENHFAPERLADEIRRALRAGSQMALPVSVVHTDGTTYVTEFLIEAIDHDDTVYYTKTNATQNSLRRPMSFTELAEHLGFRDDGLVPVTEIRASATIERILGVGSLEAFRAIFTEYGLRWYDGRLCRYVTPVIVGTDGLDQLIDAWEQRAEAILAAGVVEKNDQFRLNKHIQNRFQPVQHYLHCLLEDTRISAVLGNCLVTLARQEWDQMDTALTDILKFSSLLVQQPDQRTFDLYLKYLRRLRNTILRYQLANVTIQRVLTE